MSDQALLIGVGEYRSLAALPTASSDVHELAEVLSNPSIGGYQVHELTEAHHGELTEAINGFLSATTSDDRQIIYFAGHGLLHDDDYYLAATDTDPQHIQATALPLKSLLSSVSESQARTTLIIVDACTSGYSQVEPVARISNVAGNSRVALIHSSRTQARYSVPSGGKTVFLEALTDALSEGSADANADGVVGIHELYDYLSSRFGSDTTSYQNSLEMFLAGPDFSVTAAAPAAMSNKVSLQGSPGMKRLRPYQQEAVRAIETAIAAGTSEIAIEMAVGTGRLAVMATFVYRFMKANAASRVLYLTDYSMLRAQMNQILSSMEIEDGMTVRDICPLRIGLESLESPTDSRPDPQLLRGVFISTIQALTSYTKKHRRSSPPGLFDLIIVDDINLGQDQRRPETVWHDTIFRYEAIKVFFSSSSKKLPVESRVDLTFRYDLQSAVRDGVLVDQPTAVLHAQANTWPGFDQSDITHRRRRVFLSYALQDTHRARTIASQLNASGVDTWPGDENWQAGKDLTKEILMEIEGREVFIALLSPAWLNSPGASDELDAVLERRGIEIIPAIIRNCAIPRNLASRGVVDATHDIDGLLRRLQAGIELDFGILAPDSFQRLVQELLNRLNFRIDDGEVSAGTGHTFTATYRDTYGFSDNVRYAVEVKFAKTERPSVRAIRRLAEDVASTPGCGRGLLVTSGFLTSVAKDAISDINQRADLLRVIDGPELKSLLLSHADLITKYFRVSEGHSG